MRDVMGVDIGKMVKEEEEVFLCFDWESCLEGDNVNPIKVRYGNKKFFTTLFKTKNIDSIILLRWKNDANGHSYEIRKPETHRDGKLIRIDLTKELKKMGMELVEPIELSEKLEIECKPSYAGSRWIHIGEYGYYESEYDSWGKNFLNFYFAYPGIKIGNSLITKIEITAFDSISSENMKPLYDFMRTVMDNSSAVNTYTENEFVEIFSKHIPENMHIDIYCKENVLSASIDYLGQPQRWFRKKNIVDKTIDYIETQNPLELLVKELGL